MIPGFEGVRELSRTEQHVLYRGRSAVDGTPVLVKVARPGVGAGWLAREHRLLADLAAAEDGAGVEGVLRPREVLAATAEGALVADDPGGEPLAERLAAGRPDLATALALVRRLAGLLGDLHHRDLAGVVFDPRNLLVETAAATVALTDLTAAARDTGDGRQPLPAALLRGVLAYVSPEQTGRMNRLPDYRSDFYSLGVLLYELVTGRRPFESDDPLELIHWHIARNPQPPASLVPDLPAPVSAIALKLLAKKAEDRYQSARGLVADLDRCLAGWGERRAIDPFEPGSHDVSERFLVPQHLYGREVEVERLLAAFDEVLAGRTAMMLVAGYAGIGKTALIQELYRPIVRRRGTFVSGKFDQVERNVPFLAFRQAFGELIDRLLTEDEAALAAWRERIAAAVGPNGGVLAELVPAIERILGPQEPPPPLGATEAQNRFNLVIESFLAAVAGPDHPLVVFFDDLQWADSATLKLLGPLLAASDLRCLFLLGAYRDNEVGPDHPLARALGELEGAGVALGRIGLPPLGLDDLTRLVGDVLRGDPDEAHELAELVAAKTAGNPFFVIQFLKALREDRAIEYDRERGCWTYRAEAVAAAALTDNVVDLMTRKIRRLAPPAQRTLTLAACVGNRFDLDTLAVVGGRPREELAAELRESLHEGLLTPAGDGFESAFTFLHDRVQQAAYELLAGEERERVHLGVGRLLRAGDATGERLFEVVNHLNLGRGLLDDPAERLDLARLNLAAGRRAKASTAYQAAERLLAAGTDLLPADAWDAHYPLALELHLEAAECAYLSGEFERAEAAFALVLGRCRDRRDRARVYRLRVLQLENQSRFADAVACGKEALALFDLGFPDGVEARRRALDDLVATIRELRGGRTVASLVDLPEMTDPDLRQVMLLLTSLWAPAYIAGDPLVTDLVSAEMVRLSFAHGNTEESAYGYVTHAITVDELAGDFETGHEFGRLALAVTDRFADRRHRAKVHHMFSCFVNPWRRPLATCFPHAREAYRVGLETGDFAYASYGVFHESWYGLLTAGNLADFQRGYAANLDFLRKVKMLGLADAQRVILHWGLALEGKTARPLVLDAPGFDEEGYLATYRESPFFLTFFHVVRLHLHLVAERHAEAVAEAAAARQVVAALQGTLWPALLDVFAALALAGATEAGAVDGETAADLARLRAATAARAGHSAENFGAWAHLVGAEADRVAGRGEAAMAGYEAAIGAARESGDRHAQALAHELAGRFWLARGSERVAEGFLREAHELWAGWGAAAKAEDLRARHGELAWRLGAPRWGVAGVAAAAGGPPAGGGASALDLATVMKSAAAITAEMVLADLLRRLVKILIESAGAQRGLFLEARDGGLVVTAEGWVDRDEVAVLQEEPVTAGSRLPLAVVNYVRTSGASVISGSAADDERFAADPYVASRGTKSVLALPIVHQGRFDGIVYLENDLAADAFTEDRIQVINLLSAQAAIALENARLYGETRQEVERRRAAEEGLRRALGEVEALKNRLQAENIYLQEEIQREHNFEEMVGSSPPLVALLRQVELVAATDATVLIQGETGTGKELIARAIHDRSARRGRPLVKINCGAISAGLVESELFGHVKGAFTGALERRVGRFELADGGTLFLDEVGELPPETQVKLLRVLQEREFEPVGSSRTVRVDVRVIAATNRDLEDSVRRGRFRSDLFYRLNVFPLVVPPLRERASDVPQLVAFFLARCARRFGKRFDGASVETLERLVAYDWPGNVRELQNVVERAAILSPGPVLTVGPELLAPRAEVGGDEGEAMAGAGGDFGGFEEAAVGRARDRRPAGGTLVGAGGDGGGGAAGADPGLASLRDMEARHIAAALERTGWVVEGPLGAARMLNLRPSTLRSRMKKLGIARPG